MKPGQSFVAAGMTRLKPKSKSEPPYAGSYDKKISAWNNFA
jgi:hypothetical protein